MTGLAEPPEQGRAMLPAGTFDDKVVLVTGGGTGLGRTMPVEFARLGATVAIASRSAAIIDGGDRLRRSLRMPVFVSIRDQLSP